MDENALKPHLKELRQRLKHYGIVFAIITAVCLYFSAEFLGWMQQDLGFSLHALSAYETFSTRISLGIMGGFFLSLPVLLYQLVKFAQPGLKAREYRAVRNFLPLSVVLFAVGSVFAYEIVVKSALRFFMNSTMSAGVESVWGLQNTVHFAVKLSALTGVMFQLPVVCTVLGRVGMVDAEYLRANRPYFIVGLLLASALATPPDIVSQLLVTGPMIGLYQLSIFLVARTSG